METIKTSRIKQVVELKPFTNSYGTTIYHSLIMENGDKISIGKKKEQKPGDELTYEITDTQFEFNKAKGVQKPLEPSQSFGTPAPKNEGVQRMIVMQSSYATAVNYLIGTKSLYNVEGLDQLANHIYSEVLKKGELGS